MNQIDERLIDKCVTSFRIIGSVGKSHSADFPSRKCFMSERKRHLSAKPGRGMSRGSREYLARSTGIAARLRGCRHMAAL